jgi:crotonobetainyl-CoA:carnitine CoA-transferase CaiB-like acyl-CoA transferase
MSGPLNGVKVIDMTMNVMGPYASQTLGDMGADVCKLEPPEGDTLRGIGPARSPGIGSYFLGLNRNKRSLVLDLKKPEGGAALRRLLEQADVLLYSFRPKAMARLGASYAEVSAVNPRIVYCGAFGYGQSGPYADRPAYDDLIQAAIGLPVLQSRGVEAPAYVVTAMMDRVVGLMSASSIGMALYHRERTGEGQAIEVPMFESMVEFVMGDHLYGKTFEPPMGPVGYVRMLDKNRRPYPTKDGHIGVLVYNDKHWRRFFEAIDRPDMAADARYTTIAGRTQNISFLYAFLAETLQTRTTSEWVEFFARADIPAMPLNTPDGLLTDEHLTAVGFFKLFDHPTEGRIRMMDTPQTWSRTPPEIKRLAPRLGEHSAEVLADYGFSREDVQALREAGVVPR